MQVFNFTLILLILNYLDVCSMEEEGQTHNIYCSQSNKYSTEEKEQTIFYSQNWSTEPKQPSTFSLHNNEHSMAKQQKIFYSQNNEDSIEDEQTRVHSNETASSNTLFTPVKKKQRDPFHTPSGVRAILSPIGHTPPPGDAKFVISKQYQQRLSLSSQKTKGTSTKIYMVYCMYSDNGDKPPYVGRTKGYGDPNNPDDVENILQTRHSYHHMKSEGFGEKVKLCYVGTKKNVIRYLEDYLIKLLGGAQCSGGTSSNKIRGISQKNKNIEIYYKDGITTVLPPKLKYSDSGTDLTQDVEKTLFGNNQENEDPNIGQMKQENTQEIKPKKLIFD